MLVSLLACLATLPNDKLLVVDLDDVPESLIASVTHPFFDSLDQHGRRYTRFYTAPVCTPTRAQMHYGVHSSHPDLQQPWLISRPELNDETPVNGPLQPLGLALQSHRVTTAKVGKWHLSARHILDHPMRMGWDVYAGSMSNVIDYDNYAINLMGTATRLYGTNLTELETDLGIAAMAAGFDLVSVSYHSIHDPFHVPPGDWGALGVGTDPLSLGTLMLEHLASELDRLTTFAQVLGYQLILFSDNGGVQALGGDKGSIREGGVKNVMWCCGPDVEPGVDASLVGAYDLYDTILEFFGVPDSPDRGPESVSFLGTWQGAVGTRETVFQERFTRNLTDPADVPTDWHRVVFGKSHKLVMRSNRPRFSRVDTTTGDPLLSVFIPPLSSTDAAALSQLHQAMQDRTGLMLALP